MKKKAIAIRVTLEDLDKLPYDTAAPIKKGATVFKINSREGDTYPNGTPGKTWSSMKNSKGTFNYLVEFKSTRIINHNFPLTLSGFFTDIDGDYLSETNPNTL